MTQNLPLNGPAALPSSVSIVSFDPVYAERVGELQARVFGPGRFARTAFRLREAASAVDTLSLVAFEGDELVGSVTLSRIRVGEMEGLLLGPLAVEGTRRDVGIGKALLRLSVSQAFSQGHAFVLLVGDLPYYAPIGFGVVPFGSMVMPGPVDPSRLLVAINPNLKEPAQLTGSVRGVAD